MTIQERTGVTFIVVTHDQEEAMTLADRIAVMDKGAGPAGRLADRGLRISQQPLRRGFHRLDHLVRRDACSRGRRRRRRIDVPALGGPILRARVPGAGGRGRTSPWRVRPEKVSHHAATDPTGRTLFAGEVKDLAYFGKDSLYRVDAAIGEPHLGPLASTPGAPTSGPARLGRQGLAQRSIRPPRSC